MLFSATERAFADAVGRYAYANPFDGEAQAAVRKELVDFDLGLPDANPHRPPIVIPSDPFKQILAGRIEALLEHLRQRLRQRDDNIGLAERELLEDLIITALNLRHFAPINPLELYGDTTQKVAAYRPFCDDLARWSNVPVELAPFVHRPAHAFAIFFQYRLAVVLLAQLIRGQSRPVARLRAATWHSIFPRELRLYGVLLYERMHEVTTLILGPSGTGKELVANAIGLARFVPFDPKRERFAEPFAGAFHPINLSAMPRDLIESEMFGHVAGAFTGATNNREGWFEKCKRGHTVFLDELGELDESVQVRLLRVLQNREFYRVGDTEPRRFEGRVIAATNRELDQLIAAGRFREDLYFRLCSDVIRTPTLREQLDDSQQELPALIALAAGRCLGEKAPEEYAERLTRGTLQWIERSSEMGLAYGWPGNFRELEQCVRSVMVRGEYHPPARKQPRETPRSNHTEPDVVDEFLAEVRAGNLTIDELLIRYCSLIQSRTENVAETARRLKKHRVTVQARVDPLWVERFRQQ
jgi:transcriptional regulator with AAA-type ATPase domain